tara:strand:+ start:571 stop:720 length:150 start_codon:yes stop_codon:yes gene_type:complete
VHSCKFKKVLKLVKIVKYLIIPLYPEIKNEDIQRVASLINQFSLKKKSI